MLSYGTHTYGTYTLHSTCRITYLNPNDEIFQNQTVEMYEMFLSKLDFEVIQTNEAQGHVINCPV